MEFINGISFVDIGLFCTLAAGMIAAYYSIASKLQRTAETAERTADVLDNIEQRTRRLEDWRIRHQAFAEAHGVDPEDPT